MLNVSVHDLKAHLSHYLKIVQEGELVTVTSHDKPVVRMIQVKQEDSDLEWLLLTGKVQWNGKKPKGLMLSLKPGKKSASDIILEDRG